MHFPFRRAAPPAWSVRLPQLQRGVDTGTARAGERPFGAPPPEHGGLLLSLTGSPVRVAVAVRDVVADPLRAERLPAPALVGAILAADTENHALRRRLHAHQAELQELRKSMAEHVTEDGELRGRLRTLEEVIAALHANLDDLRIQRDQLLASR